MSNLTYFYTAAQSAIAKELVSFHTLPLGNLKSLDVSGFKEKYIDLIKSNYEITVTEPFIDSIASRSSVLKDAEYAASKTFCTDSTLFVCSGTTVSNQIAVRSLCNERSRIIAQKGLHQSFHFAINSVEVLNKTYIEDIEIDEQRGMSSLNVELMIKELKRAENINQGYDVVIVNSQTYEGIQQKLDEILPLLIEHGPSLKTIIIDEAWGAWSKFSDKLSKHCAINAANEIRKHHKIDIIITHSAHKSLFACRQASYLHCIGNIDTVECLSKVRYQIHTTSPSYKHLASLDLAQAHAKEEGKVYANRAEENAQLFKRLAQEKLSLIKVIGTSDVNLIKKQDYIVIDETKVWLDISDLKITGYELRKILYENHNIYINRYTETSALFNVHFGITRQNIERLIQSLVSIEKKYQLSTTQLSENCISEFFIISYPPGVPIIVPGERISKIRLQKIKSCIRSGALIKII